MQQSKLRPAAKEPVPSQTPGRIILQGLALINARPCFNVAWDTRGRFPPGAKPPRHRNAQACGRGQSLWAACTARFRGSAAYLARGGGEDVQVIPRLR